jgi:hypothetical protein
VTQEVLRERSARFADEVENTLRSSIPGEIEMHSIASPVDESRYVIAPNDPKSRIPLLVGGEHLAYLHVRFFLSMDAVATWVKTVQTDFSIVSKFDKTPLVRLDYRADMRTAPIAHWQIHAERGAVSHLLWRAHAVRPAEVPRPHELSSLHFPVGGERFRPCLEDFLHFAIAEMGFDSVGGWERALAEGREGWRRIQLRTMTRDAQREAAESLRELGWQVAEPEQDPGESLRILRTW